MPMVAKCDLCGCLDSDDNSVYSRNSGTHLTDPDNEDLYVSVPLSRTKYKLACDDCVGQEIKRCFARICQMIAPYQPARVSGFNQIPEPTCEVMPGEPALTKAEKNALAVLGRRLLKA